MLNNSIYIKKYLYLIIHTNKNETTETVGLLISTEKRHGMKEWKEAEYYNVDRVEGREKRRGVYKDKEITSKVYQ